MEPIFYILMGILLGIALGGILAAIMIKKPPPTASPQWTPDPPVEEAPKPSPVALMVYQEFHERRQNRRSRPLWQTGYDLPIARPGTDRRRHGH